MAIKDSAETWVRGKPVPAMILVAAIGIVIGGVLGLGSGYKVEQNRTRADVTRLQKQIKANGVVPGAGPLSQRSGSVTATAADSLTVRTKLQGTQEIHTTSATLVEQAAAGTTANITVGSRVLLTITGHDVIVLPSTSRLGRTVATVGATDFTLAKEGKAKGGKILMTNVHDVSTLTPAKLSDIKTGSDVLAGGRGGSTKTTFNAVEIILLPAGSGFAG